MVINKEVIETKSRTLSHGWSFQEISVKPLHGYEVYIHVPMNDNVRVSLSNIPFEFKLTPWDLAMWSVSRSMQSEITKELDKEIVEALVKAYK